MRPKRLIFVAQLSLFAGLIICTLLIPHFLFESNEGGISNYGTYAKTIIPYTLGFGICGLLTVRAALRIPSERKYLRWSLIILGGLYLLVLLSTYPYKLNSLFDGIHQLVGVALVSYSLILGAWLALKRSRHTATVLLFSVQCIGFVLAALTYFGFTNTLFISEIVGSVSF